LLLLGRLVVPHLGVEHGEYDPDEPQGPTQAGSRIPKTRSREYRSGSRIMRAADSAMLSRGSSAPPS
jgi:hypothetical protein